MERFRRWISSEGAVIVLTCAAIITIGLTVALRGSKWLPPPVHRTSHGGLPDPQDTGGPPMPIAIGILGLLTVAGAWFFRQTMPKTDWRPDVQPVEYTLATWVLLLDGGERYERLLSGLASDADLSRLAGRRVVAERLAALIDPSDVIDGFAQFPAVSAYARPLAQRAKRWMEALASEAAVEEESTEACLVILTFTDLSVERVPADAGPDRLVHALRISSAGHPGDDSVLFVRHRTISRETGRSIVGSLRAKVPLDGGTTGVS